MSTGLEQRGKTVKREVVELRYDDTARDVCVVPPDNDLMAMSVETAVEACRAFKTQIRFKGQFDILVGRLMQWLTVYHERVGEAYLTVRDSGLLFLVATKQPQFDLEIDNALTELDLEVANDSAYDLISLSVHSIPTASDEAKSEHSGCADSFLSHKMILRFVRNGK